MKYQKEFA